MRPIVSTFSDSLSFDRNLGSFFIFFPIFLSNVFCISSKSAIFGA